MNTRFVGAADELSHAAWWAAQVGVKPALDERYGSALWQRVMAAPYGSDLWQRLMEAPSGKSLYYPEYGYERDLYC